MSPKDCYHEDGSPHTCFACGSTEIEHVTTSMLDVGVGAGPELEFKNECKVCKTLLAYWAHGYYDPAFMPDDAKDDAL